MSLISVWRKASRLRYCRFQSSIQLCGVRHNAATAVSSSICGTRP
jgi:hypothetical protein